MSAYAWEAIGEHPLKEKIKMPLSKDQQEARSEALAILRTLAPGKKEDREERARRIEERTIIHDQKPVAASKTVLVKNVPASIEGSGSLESLELWFDNAIRKKTVPCKSLEDIIWIKDRTLTGETVNVADEDRLRILRIDLENQRHLLPGKRRSAIGFEERFERGLATVVRYMQQYPQIKNLEQLHELVMGMVNR